jgi:hypothetical protein
MTERLQKKKKHEIYQDKSGGRKCTVVSKESE